MNSDFTNFAPVGFHNYTALCLLMKHTHYFSSLSKIGREEEGEEELDESDNTLDQTIEKKTFK